ncbi:hypothetical protein M404DRAFT_36564 [Pisolithus tinctorius Marx 270]|uniref:Uncharacterized protein n=1 Tax=Pisolithus tinctorius Marx 270 TaxID=870435 RepID=A0A0C3NAK2_PISTI|nr:hypothetical protein M404DRAFT_36564 [Pisolithus tinctorius Marx 270]
MAGIPSEYHLEVISALIIIVSPTGTCLPKQRDIFPIFLLQTADGRNVHIKTTSNWTSKYTQVVLSEGTDLDRLITH